MLKFLWLWIAVALNDSYSSGYKIKIKSEKNLCNAMHVFILETVNFPPKFHLINIMKNVGFAHNNDLYDIVRTKKSFTYYNFEHASFSEHYTIHLRGINCQIEIMHEIIKRWKCMHKSYSWKFPSLKWNSIRQNSKV